MNLNRTEIIKNFRDLIALLCLVLIIPGLWVAEGLDYINLPGQVEGATILGWGWILKYYFESG